MDSHGGHTQINFACAILRGSPAIFARCTAPVLVFTGDTDRCASLICPRAASNPLSFLRRRESHFVILEHTKGNLDSGLRGNDGHAEWGRKIERGFHETKTSTWRSRILATAAQQQSTNSLRCQYFRRCPHLRHHRPQRLPRLRRRHYRHLSGRDCVHRARGSCGVGGHAALFPNLRARRQVGLGRHE